MAGTLTISTLSDGTNSTSSTNCIQGSAKAWVNFNSSSGSSCTVNASYNVSSVTYVAQGFYVVNFTNAFVDQNFVTMCNHRTSTTGGAQSSDAYLNALTNYSYTNSSVGVFLRTADVVSYQVVCFR